MGRSKRLEPVRAIRSLLYWQRQRGAKYNTRKQISRREIGIDPRARAKSEWPIHIAKSRLSELLRLARTGRPQRITRYGKEAVVMIAEEEYEKLLRRSRQPESLLEFFRRSPLVGLELEFERNKDISRDIDL